MKVLRLLIGFSIYASLGSCDERELYGSWQCVEIRDAVLKEGPLSDQADIDACREVITFDKFHRFITEGQISPDKLVSYFQYDQRGEHLEVGDNEDYHIIKLTSDTLIMMDTILDGQLKFVDKRKRVYARIH